MKTHSKHLLPEIHINPITRDIALVAVSGFLVATALLTMVVMVVSQF